MEQASGDWKYFNFEKQFGHFLFIKSDMHYSHYSAFLLLPKKIKFNAI